MDLINLPQDEQVQVNDLITTGWKGFFSNAWKILVALTTSGPTASRPKTFLWVGRPYLDTTLGKPIWYKGPGWIDSTGAPA